jgi:hypothetical protein
MFGLQNLSNTTQGILAMVAGFIPLLYVLGVDSLKIIVILGACALIGYGFILSGLYKKMIDLINKSQQPK